MSTTPSEFLGSIKTQAFTTTPVLVTVNGMAIASPRTGKFPRRIAAHNREASDSKYQERMQIARAQLAEEMDELLPDSLAKLRLKRGLSQTDLAKRMGTSQSHIAKIESGAVKLFWHTGIRLADALQVSLDALRPLVDINHPAPEVEPSDKVIDIANPSMYATAITKIDNKQSPVNLVIVE